MTASQTEAIMLRALINGEVQFDSKSRNRAGRSLSIRTNGLIG